MTNDFHDYHKKMFLESSRPFYTNNSFFRLNICLDSFFFVYLHAKCYSRKIYNRKIICKRKSHLRGGSFVLLCYAVHIACIAGDEDEIFIVVAGWNTSLLPAPHTATGIVCSLPDPTFCRVRLFF